MTTPGPENVATNEQATESFRGLSWEGRLEERFHWGSAATDIVNEQAAGTEEAAAASGIVYWESGSARPPKWPLKGTDILKDQAGEAAAGGGIVYWERGGPGNDKWTQGAADIAAEQAGAEAQGQGSA